MVEGKNIVPQGTAGTGRAVIYQDRYDPAAGFMQYAQAQEMKRLKQAQAKAAKIKEVNKKLSELDFTAADEKDRAELTAMRDEYMDILTQASMTPGADITDPTSEAGRLFFDFQKALDTGSSMTADNMKMYQSMVDAYAKNPQDYDAEEYAKRLEEYNNLGTIKERNAFLKGDGKDEEFGVGLLVPDIKFESIAEDLTAPEYESVIEVGDTTTTFKGANTDKTKALVTERLLSGNYDGWIARYVGEGKKYKDIDEAVEGAAKYMTDQVNTTYKETKDEAKMPWTWNLSGGSGIEQNGDFVFGYGVENVDGKMWDGVTSMTPNSKEQNPVINISYKDGAPKPYDYTAKNSKGKQEQVKINLTGLVEKDGEWYGRGMLTQDVPEEGTGIFGMNGSSTPQRGELVEFPLSDYDNRNRFETQFQTSLSRIDANMKEMLGQQEKEVTKEVEKAVETGIKDVAKKLEKTDEELTKEDYEIIENVSGGVVTGNTLVVKSGAYSGTYDLSNPTQRALFKMRFGK